MNSIFISLGVIVSSLLGILLGLGTAISASLLNVFQKKLDELNPFVITIVRIVVAVIVITLVITFFFEWGSLVLTPFFWLILPVNVMLEIALAYVGVRALHSAHLSIVGPLQASTALWLIPVGYFILGETPTYFGAIGVVLIVAGSVVLSFKKGEKMLVSWKSMFQDTGVRFALAQGFVASFTVSTAKLMFQYAHPLVISFYVLVGMVICLIPIVLVMVVKYKKTIPTSKHAKSLAGVGLSSGIGMVMHYIGLSFMHATYFIALKRFSTLIDVVMGKYIFKEKEIKMRFIGAVFMLIGFLCITLFGKIF